MKRPGYYVEGLYYGHRFHQARARAAHLAAEFGRSVKVLFLAYEHETPTEVCEIYNKKGEPA